MLLHSTFINHQSSFIFAHRANDKPPKNPYIPALFENRVGCQEKTLPSRSASSLPLKTCPAGSGGRGIPAIRSGRGGLETGVFHFAFCILHLAINYFPFGSLQFLFFSLSLFCTLHFAFFILKFRYSLVVILPPKSYILESFCPEFGKFIPPGHLEEEFPGTDAVDPGLMPPKGPLYSEFSHHVF